MALIWHSLKVFVLLIYCVRSENIESNDSKTSKRDENFNSEFGYENNPQSQHSQQSSSLMFNNNGNNNNNNQNHPYVQQSSSAQTYSSVDHNNGQFDKKEQKTVILAIPVKLALQSSGQHNYEMSPQHTGVQPIHSSHSSESYSNYSPSHSTQSHPNPKQLSISATSYASDKNYQNNNYQTSDVSQQKQSLGPLSQKIYSTINYPQYSTGHVSQQTLNNYNSNPSNNNAQQYKTAIDLNLNDGKDYRLNGDKYVKNDNYRSNEYKTGADDYGSNKYRNTYNDDIKYDDTNEEKPFDNLKENTKSLFDSDSKDEYDYDSNADSDHKFNEFNNLRAKESLNNNNNHKRGHYLMNNRNNRYNRESNAHKERPSNINNHNFYPSNDESHTTENNQDSDEVWNHDNYETIKSNSNKWPQIYDTINSNEFRSLNGRRIRNGKRERNPFFGSSMSDVLSESLIKAASAPLRFKSSKIYGSSSSNYPSTSSPPYQPLNLFAGFGRDYGSIDINGDLYPSALVNNHPPRKLYKPRNYEGNKFRDFGDTWNSDFVRLNQRNPFLVKHNFIPGLRASKPLANYSPFASASTTSFLSIPGIHTINKSFPRQIFPTFYG